MTKKKFDNFLIVLISIGVIIFCVASFFAYNLYQDITAKEITFSEDSFKLVSASWDNYFTEYNSVTESFEQTNEKLDWNKICELEDPSTGQWSITIQNNEDLACYFIINGVVDGLHAKNEDSYIGIKKDKRVYRTYSGIDPRIDNEISLCCLHPTERYGGEFCNSITLEKKC
jgi:hypothetical protein